MFVVCLVVFVCCVFSCCVCLLCVCLLCGCCARTEALTLSPVLIHYLSFLATKGTLIGSSDGTLKQTIHYSKCFFLLPSPQQPALVSARPWGGGGGLTWALHRTLNHHVLMSSLGPLPPLILAWSSIPLQLFWFILVSLLSRRPGPPLL